MFRITKYYNMYVQLYRFFIIKAPLFCMCTYKNQFIIQSETTYKICIMLNKPPHYALNISVVPEANWLTWFCQQKSRCITCTHCGNIIGVQRSVYSPHFLISRYCTSDDYQWCLMWVFLLNNTKMHYGMHKDIASTISCKL